MERANTWWPIFIFEFEHPARRVLGVFVELLDLALTVVHSSYTITSTVSEFYCESTLFCSTSDPKIAN